MSRISILWLLLFPSLFAGIALASDGKRLVSVIEIARGRSLHACEEIWVWEVSTGNVVQRWIRQLDDEEYAVRDQASRNLERVEGEAEAALAAALKAKCSPEAQWRIEALLETVQRKHPHLRILRAVELLEQIGTTEAVEVLRKVEKKIGDAAVRDDVRRSLDRLQAKQKAR